MNEPKRQHVVPQCYLKNFALKRKKAWYIDVCDVKKEPPGFFNANIENVAVVRDFYTINSLPEGDKRFIERFYSSTIEADYTEVYQLLTNPKVIDISPNQRFKIITFIIAQHFRTPKFVHTFNGFWEQTIRKSYDMLQHMGKGTRVYFDSESNEEHYIDFAGRTVDDVIAEESEHNREGINIENFKWFGQLTRLRLHDQIVVYRLHPSHQLITSDNPVYIPAPVFDPGNMIRMALDSHHMVAILPAGETVGRKVGIYRDQLDEERSYFNSKPHNFTQIESCTQHVFGHKDHLVNMVQAYKDTTPEKFREELAAYLKKLRDKYEAVRQWRR